MKLGDNIFGWVDYAVFAGMLIISSGIGVYFMWKGNKTTNDVLVGGKSLGVFPVAASMMATFMSATGILGVPGEIYLFGTQLILSRLILIMPFITFLTAYFIVPVFYTLGSCSSYEYLERRFESKAIRAIGCLLYCLTTTFQMGVSLYAPAIALTQVTGLPTLVTIWGTGIICTFYTTLGGMKAVVWSDAFQSIVMTSAMVWIVVKGIIDVGGIQQVWTDNVETERLELVDFDFSPYTRITFWNNVIGGSLAMLGSYGTNQAAIQRYLALPTLRGAQKTLWLSFLMYGAVSALTILVAMVIVSHYRDCDPIKTGRIRAADQIFPLFVMDVMGNFPGIPGIFIAGVFSASLSTISSGINSVSAVILEDVIKLYGKKTLSEKKSVFLIKVVSVIFGILCMSAATIVGEFGNIVQAYITVIGLLGAPMFGTFLLGLFIPWATSIGAIGGLLSGFVFNLWIGIGQLFNRPFYQMKEKDYVDGCPDLYANVTGHAFNLTAHNELIQDKLDRTSEIFPLYRISFMWYMLIGASVVLSVGTLLSFITGAQDINKLDAKLLVPIVREAVERKQKQSKTAQDANDPFTSVTMEKVK